MSFASARKASAKPTASVYDAAIRLLARREHAAFELQQKLSQRGYTQEEITESISNLQQQKLQSDERFIEAFINQRRNNGYGPVWIEQALQQLHCDSSLIAEYMDEQSEQWLATAVKVHRKKFNTPADDYALRAKQQKFLQYRGFTHAQIAHAMQWHVIDIEDN